MKSGNHDLCKTAATKSRSDQIRLLWNIGNKYDSIIFKDLSVMTDVTVKMRGKTQKGGQRVEDCEEDNLKGSSKNQVW